MSVLCFMLVYTEFRAKILCQFFFFGYLLLATNWDFIVAPLAIIVFLKLLHDFKVAMEL